MTPLNLFRLWLRARRAAACGEASGLPGMQFDRFGRELGWRLLRRGVSHGLSYMLNPVSSVRYFEFSFSAAWLPASARHCLDVSSPRLFSLYIASERPERKVTMINPDRADLAETDLIARRLGYRNISTKHCRLERLSRPDPGYDCIWAISVVEHVAGEEDDSRAVRRMFGALGTGGRLILTVPVDRQYGEEYRDRDIYGTQPSNRDGRYFFQRYYDESAIRERLLGPIGREPTSVRWFGERQAGHFRSYERRWMEQGYACTVDDPCEMASYYQEYPTWDAMPGAGVCGLVIDR